jgi:small subunit ribosomal protein S20
MATHKSAEKRTRGNAKRAIVNKSRRARTHSSIVKVEAAITAKDYKAANDALRVAQSEVARAARKGVMSTSRASRKISRLSARIKALKAK